ncbi:protein NLP7-like [Rhododendron vialii]|uniref:protein NLP7-like n=1 Tax=Rhododendron vialii TaxID=182163 RepID=UPI00265F4462|nr:protein NLP7-like [Rhododendron vialii]
MITTWKSENWATMEGHALGDKRPFEVMSFSADGKLVSRLQRIHISWLGRFAPRPSALPGGGEIVGPIALSSSEFASTNNKAQRFGQDKSGSAASDSKKKRTREQEDCEEINTSITLDDLRQHYGRKRKDVAESLGVSVSTLKRTCRQYGIKRWPNIIRKKAGRPPDQHGEKNSSPTCKTLSTNGQNEMENEIVGHLEETNEFLLDFVEGPNGGVSSEWAFQLKDQWTVSTSYPNSNDPEVPHAHIASTQILGENMGSSGDGRNSFGSLEEHLQQGHISGSMWTVPPCSDPASSQHMPTSTPKMGSSEDRINLLAFPEDVFLEEDVSGSKRWTIPTCFEPAPSQLMPTVPRTTGSSDDLRNLLPSVEECFSARHVSGFTNRTVCSCSYPGPSQPMSTVPHTTGNLLASVEEPFWAGHVSESINLTVPSCSDPGPSQSMPTIPHPMPTIPQMMPLLTGRQDMRSVRLKATYGNTTIKFPLPSGFSELKEEVSKRLEFERGSFKLEYKDEEGDSVLIACDEDVWDYLRLLISMGNQVVKLFVLDKVPNTTNFCDNRGCDNCRSLKCKRP